MKNTLVLVCCLVGLGACGGNLPKGQMPADPLAEIPAKRLYRNGVALNATHNFVRAEQYLVAAIAKGLPEKDVIPELMKSCILSNRLESAIQHGEGYLARNEGDLRLRALLASVYIATENFNQARAHIDFVLKADPLQPEALLAQEVVGNGRRPKRVRR